MPELIGLFIVVSFISPAALVIYITARILLKRLLHINGHGVKYIAGIGVILLAIGLFFKTSIVPLEFLKMGLSYIPILGDTFHLNHTPMSWTRYLIGDPISIGAGLMLLAISGKGSVQTSDRQLLFFENRKEHRRYRRLFKADIDFVPSRSTCIFGVSGAGKSAYLARQTYDTFANGDNPFVALVDGKGSVEQFSLYYSAQIIAKKFGLKLRVINGTANDSLGGTVYDFLEGITIPNQAKDMIMALIEDDTVQESSGSQHYRVLTEAYMERVITFMMQHDIRVSLSNVVKLMKPESFTAYCNQQQIPAEETMEIKDYMKKNWQDVSASVTKLELFLGDQGKKIFTSAGGDETTNLRKAYKNGEMVLVLADEMSMPQLVQGLVKVVSMDLRNLTAMRLTNQIDMDRMIYATFDEFTSYTSALPILRSMFARARSADCVITLATQSISDITAMEGNWFQSLVNTADRFVIFRQHGSESPEEAAGILGTELHVTMTSRTSDAVISGEASNTIDREFVIHPDYIRELPANTGILLDKKKKELAIFRNKFISED